MQKSELKKILKRLGACAPAQKWAKNSKLAPGELYGTCSKPGWLLWLIAHEPSGNLKIRFEMRKLFATHGAKTNWGFRGYVNPLADFQWYFDNSKGSKKLRFQAANLIRKHVPWKVVSKKIKKAAKRSKSYNRSF